MRQRLESTLRSLRLVASVSGQSYRDQTLWRLKVVKALTDSPANMEGGRGVIEELVE